MSAQTREASELLAKGLDGNGNGSQNYLLQIKPITEECNAIVWHVSERLKHTFMSALDREDIYSLVMSLTGVVQGLNKFAACFSKYQPTDCPPEMSRIVDLIQKMIRELGKALPAIDRLKQIQPRLNAISRIEREGDEVCRYAVSSLLRSSQPTNKVLMYKDLYEQLESIIEQCEHAGSLVERISIKHA